MPSQFNKQYSKEKADTVSQTGKRSRYSEQVSQTHANEQSTYNFALSVQDLMPMIESLKQQNQQLKSERDEIQEQMLKLKSISDNLLAQNSEMRDHYQQRTSDIKKVVSTMSINMNQEIQDLNHLTHMTKNHNYSIVKNIQKTKHQVEDRTDHIQKIEMEIAILAQRSTLLQQQIITKSVRIRQLEQRVNQLTLKRQRQNNIFKLEDQVDTLLHEVADLRGRNLQKLRSAQNLQTRNQIDKPHYTAENLNLIQNMNTLKQELNQMRQDSQACEKKLRDRKEYNDKIAQKCRQSNQQRQRNLIINQESESQIKKYKNKIILGRNKERQLQAKKSQIQQQKYQLEKEVQKRKEKIKKLNQKLNEDKENVKGQYKNKLLTMRSQHNVEVEKNQDQISFRLNPQREKKQQSVYELTQQYNDLCRQFQDIKKTIDNMDNPVKDIIKLQYELQKMKK